MRLQLVQVTTCCLLQGITQGSIIQNWMCTPAAQGGQDDVKGGQDDVVQDTMLGSGRHFSNRSRNVITSIVPNDTRS